MKIIIAQPGQSTVEFDAHVRGAFAVHAPDGTPLRYHKKEWWYMVTHVRTGYAVCEVKGRDKALRIARDLNRFLPEGDFTVADFETEKYKAFVQQVKPIVRRVIDKTS